MSFIRVCVPCLQASVFHLGVGLKAIAPPLAWYVLSLVFCYLCLSVGCKCIASQVGLHSLTWYFHGTYCVIEPCLPVYQLFMLLHVVIITEILAFLLVLSGPYTWQLYHLQQGNINVYACCTSHLKIDRWCISKQLLECSLWYFMCSTIPLKSSVDKAFSTLFNCHSSILWRDGKWGLAGVCSDWFVILCYSCMYEYNNNVICMQYLQCTVSIGNAVSS